MFSRLRNWINNNPAAATIIAVLLLIASLVILYYMTLYKSTPPIPKIKNWYLNLHNGERVVLEDTKWKVTLPDGNECIRLARIRCGNCDAPIVYEYLEKDLDDEPKDPNGAPKDGRTPDVDDNIYGALRAAAPQTVEEGGQYPVSENSLRWVSPQQQDEYRQFDDWARQQCGENVPFIPCRPN